jgi:hypothetical protein
MNNVECTFNIRLCPIARAKHEYEEIGLIEGIVFPETSRISATWLCGTRFLLPYLVIDKVTAVFFSKRGPVLISE